MDYKSSNRSASLTRKNRRKQVWYKVVSVMACAVVFCTTYALILPAITMTEEYYCGLEEHSHTTEECHRTGPIKTSICTAQPHQHTDSCYDADENVICGSADYFLHTHTDICYDSEGKLVCQLTEHDLHLHTEECYLGDEVYSCGSQAGEGHAHDESCYVLEDTFACEISEQDSHQHQNSCYVMSETLVCTEEEHDSHIHQDTCYGYEDVLACSTAEDDGHTHDAACYVQNSVLLCGQEETAGHLHGSACYTNQETLQCGMEENPGHTHSDETCNEEQKVLQCTILEGEMHQHDDTCQLLSEPVLVCDKDELELNAHSPDCQDGNNLFICGKLAVTEHVHTEQCFQIEELEEPELICKQEEHAHELICTSDTTADRETAEIWRTTVPGKETLTGIPAEDLLAVAKSQLGYQESTRNFEVTEEEERKGYTRYGQWYGDPYGDWCAMYVSFCLHYAGIPDTVIPYESNCQTWTEELEKLELYRPAEGYTPVPGDLVFFGEPETGAAHIGIVEEVTEEQIQTIEGNSSDRVEKKTYLLAEEENTILGYASINAIHTRGVELGLLAPLPEETVEVTRLEAALGDLRVTLVLPAGAVAEDPAALQLLVQSPTESTLVAVTEQLGAETEYTALDVLLLHGEAPVQLLQPVRLKIGSYEAGENIKAYAVAEDQSLTSMEASLGADGFVSMEITEFATFILEKESEPEYLSLEGNCNDIQVRLTALEQSFGEDASLWKLQVTDVEEALFNESLALIGADQELLAVNIALQQGEEICPDLLGGDLTFTVEEETNAEDWKLYRIVAGETLELIPVDYQQAEDGTMMVSAAEPGTYALVYTRPYEGLLLEADYGDLHIALQAVPEAFVTAPGALTLEAAEMDEDTLYLIREKLSAFKTVMGIDLQVMAGELEAAPDVPVEIRITDNGENFTDATDFVVYQYTGTSDSGALNLTELSSSYDGTVLRLTTSQMSGLVLTWEGPYEGIQLEADYGDIHIRLRAPQDAFPVTAENLTLQVTEPEESIKTVIVENMDGDRAFFAVDIQILCDGQPIQPNGNVQVIFEMKDDPFPGADDVEVFHVVEDTENQTFLMQPVEGGYNDNGDIVMETNHFSTYVVAESTVSQAATYATTPPNTWQEALTDRSSYIGVESEGYTDSPYTNTRQFAGSNITALTNSGGTVYVGGRWGIYYNYANFAETFWDGKHPVRITSDPGRQNTLNKTVYSDWILEDGVAPNGALKIDNVDIGIWLVEQKFELYGRGNKIVIGENVNTDELMNSPPYIYGGSRSNDSTTAGVPTNVVVTSGRWGLVMGGGGADVNDGTQVTIRDTAEVGIIYGGGIGDGDVHAGSSENATNVYIEGGTVTEVYGGNQTTSKGIKVNGNIHIDVSGGRVGTIHAGNDHREVEGSDDLEGSKVRGGAVVNIYNTGSVTNLIGDYMHYDSGWGDQLITLKSAYGNYTMRGRHIQNLMELNVHSNNNFGMMDYWDIIRISNLDANAAPNSVTVSSTQDLVGVGNATANIGSMYIGRMEVTNGGKFYLNNNAFINYMNEVYTTSEEGVAYFNLNHAWMGESTEERQAWSTLAIEGSCIKPSTADTNLFTLSNPCDDGRAGLRIKGNVEGFSVLEASGTPMYSTGDTYYYYVVADSSDNGGKAFKEPEGAPYVVCYRYLDDGRIGWYLRERPVLTMYNQLLRVGTDGELELNDTGVYDGCPSQYMILSVDMKGFAYEWSSNPGKNRVDFNWTVMEGSENASPVTPDGISGISIQTMADIENNIRTTENPDGIFANVVYGATGTDEGSTEQTKRVSSFVVVIDTEKAVDPRYYSIQANFHYTRAEDNYDDLRVGQTLDAARCTYDFAKDGEELGNDGYADSVMTTYAYKDGMPPKGADDALLRVYLPEGVSASTLTVKENDDQFTFEETGKAASLVSNSQVAQYYSTEEESTYNHLFGVTLQQTGESEIDLAGGATLSSLSGKETYHCSVYSHEKINYTDITPESNLGLQLLLQLNTLTKDGNAVGNGDPSAINDGELRIQVLPVGSIVETTTISIKKIVTGENPDPDAEFDFLLSYPQIDENGNQVTHEERFALKHEGVLTFIVPLDTAITVTEIGHDGYNVYVKDENGNEVHSDTVSVKTPDQDHLTGEELTVTFYNSAGAELPESGGNGTYFHTFLGLLLMIGAIVLLWIHRRERGAAG